VCPLSQASQASTLPSPNRPLPSRAHRPTIINQHTSITQLLITLLPYTLRTRTHTLPFFCLPTNYLPHSPARLPNPSCHLHLPTSPASALICRQPRALAQTPQHSQSSPNRSLPLTLVLPPRLFQVIHNPLQRSAATAYLHTLRGLHVVSVVTGPAPAISRWTSTRLSAASH